MASIHIEHVDNLAISVGDGSQGTPPVNAGATTTASLGGAGTTRPSALPLARPPHAGQLSEAELVRELLVGTPRVADRSSAAAGNGSAGAAEQGEEWRQAQAAPPYWDYTGPAQPPLTKSSAEWMLHQTPDKASAAAFPPCAPASDSCSLPLHACRQTTATMARPTPGSGATLP